MADILDNMQQASVPGNVSPVFVGRTAELEMLSEAFDTARAGSAWAVLLGGEAGVGKTRLLNEFATRVHDQTGSPQGDGPRVLVGGCLELSAAGLPYAPFTAVLRHLVRDIGADGIAALMPGGTTRDLGRLLPGLGEAPADPDPDSGRVRLFEQMLTLLERLAAQSPVLLLIEDAHWADRSTRDLLAFLVRNLHGARVLLTITYRSDELHRTHPLRPLLAELSRVDTVTRFELSRLSQPQVADQLAGILGHAPDQALIQEVFGRSSGIPLFVEATARCADEPVPATLRDLLLAGVQRLPEETQEVLRTASAAAQVSHDLLAAATGLEDRVLSQTLRPAVDGNVLVPSGPGYAFRHALIREAIHEDLLPGEHTRLHRRFAEALERNPRLGSDANPWVSLAEHWHHAHVNERALPAAWRAAAESAAALAYAEQVEMLERVLELWDRVPNARELVGGHDQVDILEMAAEAASVCAEVDRGLKLVRAALAELDETAEPERYALLLLTRAKLRCYHGKPGELDDLLHAEKLAVKPGLARARVLTRLASFMLIAGRDDECRAYGLEALDLARTLGDTDIAAEVHTTLASVVSDDGEGDITELLAALAESERLGNDRQMLRALVNVSHYYEGAGQHERSIAAACQGIDIAQRIGRTRSQGAFVTCNLIESLVSMGRWDEAGEAIERALTLTPAPALRASVLHFRGRIALARGDRRRAVEALEAARKASFNADAPQHTLPYVRLMINLRIDEGDLAGALDVLDQVLGNPIMTLTARYTWPVLTAGVRAVADITTDPALIEDRELQNRAADRLAAIRALAAATPAASAVTAADAVTFAAESVRADGALDLPAWDTAAAAWQALGQPYSQAWSLVRAAEAAAAENDRQGAADRLRRAAELGERLAAKPLLDRIAELSRRARLPERRDEPRLGLTSRELEVLRLVTAGHTNREIAQTLSISAKTASVHVSNILGKLGVSGRGEAAATARRLGVFD